MAERLPKPEVREIQAFAREIHISPRKVRLVANLVKDLPVDEALTHLGFLNKKAANPVRKLIDSAISNASHNFQIEANRLFIKNITVDGGRAFFRYQPRAQGRAFPVRKRTSHINLVLAVSPVAIKSKRNRVSAKVVHGEAPAKVEEPKKPSEPAAATEAQGRRWMFWRRRGSKTRQVPPKVEGRGKKYTSFDRRGGE